MLGPTDQGHFLKYLTTLGVAIVVASLGLGGYLLQTQSDLLIKREELAKFTPVAREAIDHKQQVVLQVTTFAPWVLGLMIVAGVSMAVVGLTGWRTKQALLDERDRVELAKANRELDLMQMTPEEAQESLAAEAEELVEDEMAEHVPVNELVHVGSADARDMREPSEHTRDPEPVSAWSAQRRVSQATEVLFHKLQAAYPGADIRQNIRLGRFSVDALAVFEKERRVLAFELTITNRKNFVNRLMDAAIALSAAAASLTGDLASYRVVPVFVLLLRRDDHARLRDRLSLVNAVSDVSAAVRYPPVVLLFEEEEWEGLPARTFRAEVANEEARVRDVR